MHSPYEEHLEVVFRILRCLKTTPGKGLLFEKPMINAAIFTDAGWVGSVQIESLLQDIEPLCGVTY
jgi:hypothetical protein